MSAPGLKTTSLTRRPSLPTERPQITFLGTRHMPGLDKAGASNTLFHPYRALQVELPLQRLNASSRVSLMGRAELPLEPRDPDCSRALPAPQGPAHLPGGHTGLQPALVD